MLHHIFRIFIYVAYQKEQEYLPGALVSDMVFSAFTLETQEYVYDENT